MIYLYAYDPAVSDQPPEIKNETETVPNVVGMRVSSAIMVLTNRGFNVDIKGSLNYDQGTGAIVTQQSYEQGTVLPKGSVITIVSMHTDVSDND